MNSKSASVVLAWSVVCFGVSGCDEASTVDAPILELDDAGKADGFETPRFEVPARGVTRVNLTSASGSVAAEVLASSPGGKTTLLVYVLNAGQSCADEIGDRGQTFLAPSAASATVVNPAAQFHPEHPNSTPLCLVIDNANSLPISMGLRIDTTGPDVGGDDDGGGGDGGDGDDDDDDGDGDDDGDDGDDGDDDGDDDDDGVTECGAPLDPVDCDAWGSGAEWTHALGLACDGDATNSIPLLDSRLESEDPLAWALVTGFGTHEVNEGSLLFSPRQGEQMLLLSTGLAGVPNELGRVTQVGTPAWGSNANPDGVQLPGSISPLHGSNGTPFQGCDGENDCSDSLLSQWQAGGERAEDLIWLRTTARVPAQTHGFALDFAFFSQEFPEYVNTQFNDMFIVWSDSESYTGNLCFVDGNPCSVSAAWPVLYGKDAPELAGTAFSNDGGTGWNQIVGPAEPGEELQLTFALFDMGDDTFDTAVLLDGFRWDCEGCGEGGVGACGVD